MRRHRSGLGMIVGLLLVAGTELAAPSVGHAVGESAFVLDNTIVDALCRDRDGCQITLTMVNWDEPGQPGSVASVDARLFISETSRWWRLSDFTGPVTGNDGNGAVQEWAVYDCYFTDGESYAGMDNDRADTAVGFGLLNCKGCTYSDATTTCRVVIQD